MKAEELMVGDWVYAIDVNGEKHPCRANNLEYDYINKRGDFCVDFYGTGYEAEWPDVTFNVEPIPLTPEILEKNLGVLERSSDGYNLVINSELILAFHLEATLDVWIAQPRDWPHLTYSLPLPRYVHELQHALRLCGIEKEIEL